MTAPSSMSTLDNDAFVKELIERFEHGNWTQFYEQHVDVNLNERSPPWSESSSCEYSSYADDSADSNVTIASLMAMSEEELNSELQHSFRPPVSPQPTPCARTSRSTHAHHRTISHLKRKSVAMNSSEEHTRDALAESLAHAIEEDEARRKDALSSAEQASMHLPHSTSHSVDAFDRPAPPKTAPQPPSLPFDDGCMRKLSMNAQGAINAILEPRMLGHAKRSSGDSVQVSLQTNCRKKMSSGTGARDKKLHIDGVDECVSAAVCNYLHQCQVHRVTPTFDHIHNICVNVRKRQASRKAQAQYIQQFNVPQHPQPQRNATGTVTNTSASKAIRLWNPNRIRQLTGELVVELWRCSLSTPFIKTNKRSSDTFKQFAAGVLFVMRSGITIRDTHTLVPHSKSIEQTLRLTETVRRGTPAHRVHLQAHKGVSTLQRCINSITDQRRVLECYASAIKVATELQHELDASASRTE